MTTIAVSEMFYSIQGEGSTVGKPSFFVRLSNCNLLCGGKGTIKDKQLHNGAKWRCDTIEVWLNGKRWNIDELAENIFLQLISFIEIPHLIFTGGEPLMCKELPILINKILQRLKDENYKTPFIEVETNTTIAPSYALCHFVNQFNCSPKLSNSGMDKQFRYHPEVIQSFIGLTNSIFKFVLHDQDDLEELFLDYIGVLKIPYSKVWLMPAASDELQLKDKSKWLVEVCKEYGFNFSSRLQVAIWNETTGV